MAQSQHSKAASQADPTPALSPTNVPAPANAPPPAQLALFSTLASVAKLLLEALGNRDLNADNHFTLETLRRAIRVSEPYIDMVLRELESHEISAEAGPWRSCRRDEKSKSKSKSQGLLRYLPKLISIASQLAKTREKRPNGSVRSTLLQELHEFLREELKAARKEVKRLEHVLEGKHKRPRHRRQRGEKKESAEGKKRTTAGGEERNGGEEEDEGDDEGDGDDDDAPLLEKGSAASNEAASDGKARRSAEPSGDGASQRNDDRGLVIRVQSPSTQRSERVNSRASSVASQSSRPVSHHTGSVVSETPSSRLIVVEEAIAARSRSRSTPRTERLSSPEGPVEVLPSPYSASSYSRSSVSKELSSRHIIEETSGIRSQSHSSQGSKRGSNHTGSGLASPPSHPGSKNSGSIASRGSSKQYVADQVPAVRSRSQGTQSTEESKRACSATAAPPSRLGSIRPTTVASKNTSSQRMVDQAPIARPQSPNTQVPERPSERTSPVMASRSSGHPSKHARSSVSRASSSGRVVDEAPEIKTQSQKTQERMNHIPDSVRRTSNNSRRSSSKASSSQHSRVTRAPTVSTSSSRSSAPSSTVANVDDSKARRSGPGSATHGSNRALQSSHSSPSRRSQPGSTVPSPAPSEEHTASPKAERSNKASSHGSEKEKPKLKLRISDLQDGHWTFQQLPISSDGEIKKTKMSIDD